MTEFISSIVKFVIAVLLIPVVCVSATTFHSHLLSAYPQNFGEYFLWGGLAFLAFFLFLYQFVGVYELGQKVMLNLLQFTAPFDEFLSYLIPFYMLVTLLLFYVMSALFNVEGCGRYFMFLSGFTFTMHIILIAQELQVQDESSLKGNYLFLMSISFIVNILLLVLLLDLTVGKTVFVDFFNQVLDSVGNFYTGSLKRI